MKGEIHGAFYESVEEHDTICWLQCLKRHGLCDFGRSRGTVLFKGLSVPAKNRGKSKPLLNEMGYTPDFDVVFDPSLLGHITWTDGMKPGPVYVDNKGKACFEVKGTFRNFDTDHTAPVKIKVLYMLTGKLVQIIRPYQLMKRTWYPPEMYFTPKGKERTKDGKRCKEFTFEKYAEGRGIPLRTGGEPFPADTDRTGQGGAGGRRDPLHARGHGLPLPDGDR